jgi:hypothetical protein
VQQILVARIAQAAWRMRLADWKFLLKVLD